MPKQLPLALLLLRLGIFSVFLFWTLDKLVNPEHSAKVFSAFYGMGGLDLNMFYVFGVAQLCANSSLCRGGPENLDLWRHPGVSRGIHAVCICQIPATVRQPSVLCRLADAGRLYRPIPASGLRYADAVPAACSRHCLTGSEHPNDLVCLFAVCPTTQFVAKAQTISTQVRAYDFSSDNGASIS